MKIQELRQAIGTVLIKMDLWSAPAEELLIGTAAHESAGLKYFKQLNGPALGLFQMEPATLDDIYYNYLNRRLDLKEKFDLFRAPGLDLDENLRWNIPFQIAAARIHYYRKKPPIPETIAGQADYWKTHYNTPAGKGTVKKYLDDYQRYVQAAA